jgi:hypothetical protein
LGLGAVLADVPDTRAVVALGSLDTVTRQVTYTTTGIAALLRGSSASTSAEGTVAAAAAAAFSAGTGHVASLSATVAFAATAAASSTSTAAATPGAGVAAAGFRAVAGLIQEISQPCSREHWENVTNDMTSLAALVARLGLGLLGALSGDVSLTAA